MFKSDREMFEKIWDDVKVFIEYGMLTEEKFFEKAKNFYLYKNTEKTYSTIEELIERVKEKQKNKDGKTILLYTHSEEEQHSFIQSATQKGYEVLNMEGPLVSHLISKLESTNSDIQFARVDADTVDKLIEKDETNPSLLSEDEENQLKEIIESEIEKEKYSVQIQNLSSNDAPFIITQSEFMRRMKEQQQLSGGGMQMFGQMPENYNLVVNSNHALVSKILEEKGKNKELINQFLDLALLSQGLLKGEKLTKFIQRSVDLI
jgi:molecular chaperone HtpG